MANWFQRWFILPKAKNSFDDIFPELKGIDKAIIRKALTGVVDESFRSAGGSIPFFVNTLLSEIEKVSVLLPKAAQDRIRDEIANALSKVQLSVARDAVLNALFRAFGV